MYRIWYWAMIDRGSDGRFIASVPDLGDLAAYGERPCSIAALILWQRTQSGLSVISATHSWGRAPVGLLRLLSHKGSMCLCRVFHRDDIKEPA